MPVGYNQNLHTHSLFCDGKNSCEDTVLRALELGFDSLGFSGHSYMAYSPSYSMSVEGTEEYKREIARLKEKYRDQLDIFCGIEFDMYSSDPLEGYDFVLGAFHYLHIGDEYVGIDRSADEVQRIIDVYFQGDGLKLAKAYYEGLAQLPRYAGKLDIVAHMDLIAKHNYSRGYFDTDSKEYRSYVMDAIDALTEKCRIFEINTGGIPRGYRSVPYPDPFVLKELCRRGCGIVISSDCHDNRHLNCQFDECLELARACGFKEVLKLTKKGFSPLPI